MTKKKKPYLWLLGINLFIGTFTFGGGYVVVPMVRRYFVEQKQLFAEDELTEMAAIAQSAPGAIAINLLALAGYRAAGITGTIISCLASIVPPLVILGAISVFYDAFISNVLLSAVLKGMQAGVAALIVDVVADMCRMITKQRSPFLTALIPIVFAANFIWDINVAFLLIICCFVCVLRVLWGKRRNR